MRRLALIDVRHIYAYEAFHGKADFCAGSSPPNEKEATQGRTRLPQPTGKPETFPPQRFRNRCSFPDNLRATLPIVVMKAQHGKPRSRALWSFSWPGDTIVGSFGIKELTPPDSEHACHGHFECLPSSTTCSNSHFASRNLAVQYTNANELRPPLGRTVSSYSYMQLVHFCDTRSTQGQIFDLISENRALLKHFPKSFTSHWTAVVPKSSHRLPHASAMTQSVRCSVEPRPAANRTVARTACR